MPVTHFTGLTKCKQYTLQMQDKDGKSLVPLPGVSYRVNYLK